MAVMPWGKWFWRDWMSDLGLRACSPAARGVWMDMLCVAGQANPPGYVMIAGKSIDDAGIARLCSITLEEAQTLRKELETNEIFSRNRVGTIYCRRMVRDFQRAQLAIENGKKGGNPNLRKGRRKSAPDKPVDNPTPTEASSQPPTPPFTQGMNGLSTVGDKAQKPEARDQRPDSKENPIARTSVGTARALAKPSEEDIAWGSARQQIVDAYERASNPNPPNTNWVDIWRKAGYDPGVCVTTVREILARKGTSVGGSLKYFDGAIEEAHVKIRAARAAGGIPKDAGIDWERVMTTWKTSGEQIWLVPASPRPGQAGCRVPREVLARHMPEKFPPLQS